MGSHGDSPTYVASGAPSGGFSPYVTTDSIDHRPRQQQFSRGCGWTLLPHGPRKVLPTCKTCTSVPIAYTQTQTQLVCIGFCKALPIAHTHRFRWPRLNAIRAG